MTTNGERNNTGLAKLLNQLNLPTLAMILLMGGGNWFETRNTTSFNAREIERATEEIHQLYARINDAIERQKKIQEGIDQLLRKP